MKIVEIEEVFKVTNDFIKKKKEEIASMQQQIKQKEEKMKTLQKAIIIIEATCMN